MKKELPRYKSGEVENIKNGLSENNRKILDRFLTECRIGVKDKSKLGNIERHMIEMYDISGKDFDKWTPDIIIAVAIVIKNSDRSVWTIAEFLTYLKKFIRLQYKGKMEMLEVLDKIKKPQTKLDDFKINENTLVTPEELELMLRKTENFRQKALLCLFWESGARPQEILNLRWRDIKFEDDEITIITLHSGKTNSTRTFPVKESSIHLKRWKQEYCFPDVNSNDWIFPNPDNRENPITNAGLNKFLEVLSKKAGIKRRIWAYLFRHTRATKLYEELPRQICEKLLGHKNMAGIYAHISDKKAREELINKVYHIEELSPEKKAELEKQLEEQNKRVVYLEEQMKKIDEVTDLLHNQMLINAKKTKSR